LYALLHALTAFQGPDAGPSQANPLLLALPWVAIFVIFYFLLIRPQSKRQKQHKKLVESLEKGDKVVSAGGIHGTVQGVDADSDTVTLEVGDKVRIRLSRGSVARVVKD